MFVCLPFPQGVRNAGERVIVFTQEKNEAFADDPDPQAVCSALSDVCR